ncbi:MraY family glycosyltransferase [Geothrix sp. 21YS21S-4]|uniref:MraY family glycosyltransferase n=1 Tax=Geothrix sp. 21YS21S-4 TaxID=3068889 RepID=UPI0027BA6D5D|nr:MraY family glycosyltransferase [Geothrix sp. 21YS21S-4]
MDRPDEARKHHTRPIARTGGLALWLLFAGAQITGRMPFHLNAIQWMGIHAMALVGLLDDRFNLRPRYKALAGLGVSLLLAAEVVRTSPLAGGTISLCGINLPNHPAMIFPLMALWFWALPQAYNLIDGINGLSMGFAALLLGVIGWNLGGQSALLWGGLAAVFLLNFPKARHFLGDCGALMLGTFFAVLGVKAFALRDPNLLLWVFAYPIVDVSLVVGIRRWKGLPLAGADRSHLHHWMMDQVGGRSWVATPILLGVAVLPMLRASGIPGGDAVSALGLAFLLLLAFKAFKDRVTRLEKGKESTPTRVRRAIPFMAPAGAREPSGSHSQL